MESWKETHAHLNVKFEIDCDVKIAKEFKFSVKMIPSITRFVKNENCVVSNGLTKAESPP